MTQNLIRLFEEHRILLKHNFPHDLPLPHPVTDNRELKRGDCFIAIRGANFDGNSFLPGALKAGAALTIGESEKAHIVVSDSRKAAALYAKLYYGDPSQHMTMYGVTGTNGKTTSSLMLYQMLLRLGYRAAWIGTLGYKILEAHYATQHTTPDILQLNSIFADMRNQGVTHVVMEVSSHALTLDRVYGVDYDYCLFTNLSRDHLDFHKDMDDYFEAKYLLFERAVASSGKCIINGDDAHGRMIIKRIANDSGDCLVVGRDAESSLRIEDPEVRLDGSKFRLRLRNTEFCDILSPLVGDFNVDNLALACGALVQSGIRPEDLPALVAGLQPVPGRIEAVPNSKGIGVYVDYAHSPDALDNLLKSVEKLPHNRIITVFGAGGDRDQGKRPLMLKAALSHSDAVIVTDDNPRSENPDKIIHDIVRDSDWALPWWIIRDRAKAIEAAINLALPNDVVLICGKGHETYQEIQGIRHEFSDRQWAETALQAPPLNKSDDELVLGIDPLLIRMLLDNVGFDDSYHEPQLYRYISTDSRMIKPGSVFFALKGENFDGNQFVSTVLEDSSVMAVSSAGVSDNPRRLISENPELVMASLLRKYLQMFSVYKIAITGSTGKTSSKELLAKVLSYKAEVLKTAKNENNIIGLCKTILRLEPHHKFAVFEIGTNHFGEISRLADTITPDAGIILNIGPSHLEYFGDENGVFKEKSELFNRPLDLRLYPADDARFEIFKQDAFGIGFNEKSDYRITNLDQQEASLSFDLGGMHWSIPYSARHFVMNSAFAIVTAMRLGLIPEDIQAALSTPLDLDMRMQIENHGGKTLIIDCYNANPVSMQSAIEFWHNLQYGSPHIAFLGDMLELGESSELYHRMIGAIIADMSEEQIITIGSFSRFYQVASANHYDNVDLLLADFPKIPDDCVILVKGSHSVHLEKILPKLRGEI